MVDCDECNSSFDSEHGLEVHMGMKHPEIARKRTCAGCGKEFQSQTKKKFCRECNPFAGENNGNYKGDSGAKEKTSCNECGTEFEYYPSDKEGQYCSECQKERPWASRDSNIRRIQNWDSPAHIGNSQVIECDWCESSIERQLSMINDHNFCCKKCQSKWLSEEFTGEGHPNWEENYPTNKSYGKVWRRVRSEALERDDYTCQKCGVDREELDKNPDVHHIQPIRTFENEQEAHTLDNVVSLCPSCHQEEEERVRDGRSRSLDYFIS